MSSHTRIAVVVCVMITKVMLLHNDRQYVGLVLGSDLFSTLQYSETVYFIKT